MRPTRLWSKTAPFVLRHVFILIALAAGGFPSLSAEDRPPSVPTTSDSSPEEKVNAFILRRTLTDGPGLAVLIAQDGKIVFEKGYGLARDENSRPITPSTKFRIGAISNQFTAAAILKLQEQGKLSVTDTLDRYFTGFPRAHEVTLHHLLTHTSGIHSYTQDPDFREKATNPITPDALFDVIKQYGPDFTPGLIWSYSNSGYVILGRIIEKVSGQTYEDFLRQTFFEPLGMGNTGVYHNDAPPANAASGYAYRGRSYKPSLDWDMSWLAGAGSLYSTVEDLFRWNEALYSGAVLEAKSREAAFSPVKTGEYTDTKTGDGYGYGLSLSHYRGAKLVSHGGGLDGFSSYLLRLPKQNCTIAILGNALPLQGGMDLPQVGNKIVEIYFERELDPVAGEGAVTSVSKEALDAIVGRYDFGTVVMTVKKEADRVFYSLGNHRPLEIFPKSEIEFEAKIVEVRFKFVKDKSGKVVEVVRDQNNTTQTAPRIEDVVEIKLEPKQLEPLAGEYDYGQGVTGTFSLEGDRFFGQLTGERKFELGGESETEFFLRASNGRIRFVKDEKGNVIKLIHRQKGEVREATKRTPSPP